MLDIDCSTGEGGGQIVRTALAMAVVTGLDVRLHNIRANRPKPGLSAQHITAVKALAKLCDGSHSPLDVGTSTLTFHPGKIQPDKYSFDIGTAGSITLVFQAWLLPVLVSGHPTITGSRAGPNNGSRHGPGMGFEITLKGGTDVKWSPAYDYFTHVFLPHLNRLGVELEISLRHRGYYPSGGGEVVLKANKGVEDQRLNLEKRGELNKVCLYVNSRLLPSHVTTRIINTVKETLKTHNQKYPQQAVTILDTGSGSSEHLGGPGTGVVLTAEHEHTTLGASRVGEKGVPAERVGKDAAEALMVELDGGGTVDIFAADQLIPYLAINGGCFTVRELSSHANTNIWLMEQFGFSGFKIEECEKFVKITY